MLLNEKYINNIYSPFQKLVIIYGNFCVVYVVYLYFLILLASYSLELNSIEKFGSY